MSEIILCSALEIYSISVSISLNSFVELFFWCYLGNVSILVLVRFLELTSAKLHDESFVLKETTVTVTELELTSSWGFTDYRLCAFNHTSTSIHIHRSCFIEACHDITVMSMVTNISGLPTSNVPVGFQ